ncbi:MAG: hypothetical protein ACK5DG_08280 [Chitinophagaceae bacterium]|jgi:hypothetical protein
MKKILTLLVAVLFTLSAVNAGMIVVPAVNEPVKKEATTPADVLSKMDPKAFLALTPAKIQEMTGKKMSLKQKLGLKLVQRDIKRQLKKGKEVNMAEFAKKASEGIDILWFLLGVVLGLIGVIIALITKKGKDDNRVRSSLIGWLVWIAIVAIGFIL